MKVFVSYAWDGAEHRKWVLALATRLRNDGVDVTLDYWHLAPGDQLSTFMEKSVRENNFVVVICTPKYKARSDRREGGVGYEGDIMTAEVLSLKNHRKFIPVLGNGEWGKAAPSWLAGKRYIDLSDSSRMSANYPDLRMTLLGQRPTAPPLGSPFTSGSPEGGSRTSSPQQRDAWKLHEATSPIVGTVYLSYPYGAPGDYDVAPYHFRVDPEDAPVVSVGARVKKGQVIAFIESLAVVNAIESEVDGTVVEVPIRNGESVAFGEVILRVRIEP